MLKALNYFHTDNTVFELTALKVKRKESKVWNNEWVKPGGTVGGYFQDHEKAVEAAIELDQKAHAESICITANPVNPQFLGRANERLKPLKSRVGDADSLGHRHLIIDIDPKRISGISSTDEEHHLAINTAKRIAYYLTEKGWPEPLIGDSGNGAHLIYKIDLPNETDSRALVDNCLKAIGNLFSNDQYEIDPSLGKSGQLIKLYGTTARKGDSIPDRPHRISRILSCPEKPRVVPMDYLKSLAQSDHTESSNEKKHGLKNEDYSFSSGFDIESYLKHYDVTYSIKQKPGATLYVLNNCLFNPSHGSREAAIVMDHQNGLRYQCFHSSCKDKTWHEARKIISGDDSFTAFINNMSSIKKQYKQPEMKSPKLISFKDLLEKPLEPTQWIIEGLLPQGLAMLTGKPKVGKSWMAFNLALSVATGKPALGKFPVNKCSVLYLALEDTFTDLQERGFQILGDDGFEGDLQFATQWKSIRDGGLDDLRNCLKDNEAVKLVIVDTMAKMSRGKSGKRDVYQADYDAISELKEVADEFGIALLVVHHLRKTEAENNPFDQISGSTGITGAADTLFILHKDKHNDNDATLKCTGRKTRTRDWRLSFNESSCSWSFEGDEKELRLNPTQSEIIDLIRGNGGSMCIKDIETSMADRFKNKDYVRVLLSRLCKNRALYRSKRGVYNIFDTSDTIQQYQVLTNDTNLIQNDTMIQTNDTKIQTEDNHNSVHDEFVSNVSSEIQDDTFGKPVIPRFVSNVSNVSRYEDTLHDTNNDTLIALFDEKNNDKLLFKLYQDEIEVDTNDTINPLPEPVDDWMNLSFPRLLTNDEGRIKLFFKNHDVVLYDVNIVLM